MRPTEKLAQATATQQALYLDDQVSADRGAWLLVSTATRLVPGVASALLG